MLFSKPQKQNHSVLRMKYSSLAASACLAHGCQQRFQCRVTMALLSVVGPDPPPAGFWARDRHTRSARCCAPRSQPSGGPSDWLLPAPVALLSGAGKGQRAPRPRCERPRGSAICKTCLLCVCSQSALFGTAGKYIDTISLW